MENKDIYLSESDELLYLEMIRLSCKRKNTIGTILLIFSIILIILGFSFEGIILYIGIIGFIISFILIALAQSKFKKEISNSDIFADLVNSILPDANVDVNKGLPMNVVKESGLEKLYNRYHSDFYVSGNYKNVLYETANVLIQEHRSNGKNSSTVTMFSGVIYSFDFEKDIDVSLKIFEKNDTHLKKGLNKIETESISFNKKFKTFTNDDLKTFYILTPEIQEMMLKIEETFPGKVEFSYENGKMYIGIESQKVGFKFSLKNPVSDNFDYIEKQFSLIPKFIEVFKLSTSKYTKAETVYKSSEEQRDNEIKSKLKNNGWG